MTAFAEAWLITKSVRRGGVPDIDYRLLAEIVGNRDKYEQPQYGEQAIARILEDIMRDETTQQAYPTAKTPNVYRSMPQDEAMSMRIGDQHANRYFSPQRLVPHYYSHYWGGPRRIGQFEMPVPFQDDSVLDISGNWHNDHKTLMDPNSPEIERIAEGSRISPEEAIEAMKYWHSAYMGAPNPGPQRDAFNDAMRNAGYDYMLHNEYASQDLNPPIWDKFRSKAGHGIHSDLDSLSEDIDQVVGGRMPFRSAWHVGDKESAPVFTGLEEQSFSRPNFTSYRDSDLQDLLFGGYADHLYTPMYGYKRRMEGGV